MDKVEVQQLFTNFEFVNESNQVVNVGWATEWYGTNKNAASWIAYASKDRRFEMVLVYFDANQEIIAYKHLGPD